MTTAQNFVREINSIENPDYQDIIIIALKFDNKHVRRNVLENGIIIDKDMIRFSDGSRCFVFYNSSNCEYVDKICVTKKKWEEVFPDDQDCEEEYACAGNC